MTPQKHDFGISDQGELWGNPLGHIGGPNAQIPSRIDAEVAEPEITYFVNCPYSRSLACRWMWRLLAPQAEVAVVATEAGSRFSHRPPSPAV